jgi:hypothetical protein
LFHQSRQEPSTKAAVVGHLSGVRRRTDEAMLLIQAFQEEHGLDLNLGVM